MQRVYVPASAVSISWSDRSKSLADLLCSGALLGFANAGMPASVLDVVMPGTHDLVESRNLMNRIAEPGTATFLKDEAWLREGGTAFVHRNERVLGNSAEVHGGGVVHAKRRTRR